MLSTYPTAERPSRLNLTCLSVCVCLALLLGGTVYISVPECGIDGNAQVLRIEACPAIKPGTGHVIIGKFIHHSARVIDLHVSGEPKPIGTTDNHLFWSETQQDFVPAGQLAISETLLTKTGTATVTAIMPRGPPETVYNLEVHGHHVYQVGSQCLLVHNGGVCPPGHTGYGAFGKGRAAKEVIIDTDAVIGFKDAKKLLKPGEIPVITTTTQAELRALVKRGKLRGMPHIASELKRIGNPGSVDTRILVRGTQENPPGKIKGSLFGDGANGAAALDTGRGLITFDKKLRKAVQLLGGDVR